VRQKGSLGEEGEREDDGGGERKKQKSVEVGGEGKVGGVGGR